MGYEIEFKNVNWKQPLSPQVFAVEPNAVIFGFSLGTVLARLIAQKYTCEQLICASMTPLHCFEGGEMRQALVELLGSEFVDDVQNNLMYTHYACKQPILYGEKEHTAGMIIVPKTGHAITDVYIAELVKLL